MQNQITLRCISHLHFQLKAHRCTKHRVPNAYNLFSSSGLNLPRPSDVCPASRIGL